MSPEVVRLDEQKLARAALTYLAEPADPALGALLGICEPAEAVAAIKAGMLPGWLRGRADLGLACQRSVSVVGSRAASGYGAHVACDLGERGWAIVSGGA